MALIGQIRKRGSWILIILIGLGLGGFIIQDMLISGPSAGMGSQPDLGAVNGEEIEIRDFQRVEQIALNGAGANMYAQRSSLWEFFVENKILQQYADEMGLNVSLEELKALEFGPNYSPVIVQNFPNPQVPGLPNTEQLNQLRTLIEGGGIDNAIAQGQLAPNFRDIWRYQERLVIKDRMQTKFNSIVEKGLYTPSWMAEDMNTIQGETVNLNVVKVPFDELGNDEVSLSDADFESYLEENAHLFEREEETRKISYVTFNVEATPEDTANVKNSINELITKWEASDNDTIFVQANQGTFNGSYVKSSQVSAVIADTLASMSAGDIYGPYFEGGQFKAVRVMDRLTLPDSVRSRHILLRLNPADPTSFATIQGRVDSIKNAIEAGTTTFEAMNERYNEDVVAKEAGGDLGYAGLNAMVKPFNDLIYFEAEEGKYYTVTTQFGIHLVEVLGKQFINNDTGYLLGYLAADVIPSDATQKDVYNKAFAFMTDNRSIEDMTAAASNDPAINVQSTSPFDVNAYQVGFTLPAGQSSRNMIKWAYEKDTKVGKVSSAVYEYSDPIKYFDNLYVVAALESILKPGFPKVDEVRSDIEPAVTNLKKGEMLQQRMAGKSLSEIASTFGASVDSVSNVNFNSSFLQNIGNEPKVVGEAFQLGVGQSSGPIVGSNGVYVIQVTSKTPAAAAANIPQLRQQYNTTTRSRVSSQFIAAIKDKAKIKDNRSIYY